ncbi:MAG: hypothetical protein MUF13_10280 [Akkermansiaceae bacterium]|jgi:hypothetical protein|nr:hypothetical protein [Akkermansiaceae bacterium]
MTPVNLPWQTPAQSASDSAYGTPVSLAVSGWQLAWVREGEARRYVKPSHAFLGTTNLDLGSLTERFQT